MAQQGVGKAPKQLQYVVVPADTAEKTLQLETIAAANFNIAGFVDSYLGPDLSAMLGYAVSRQTSNTPVSSRAFYLTLATSGLVSAAPWVVQELTVQLPSSSPQSYVRYGEKHGDIWIVSNTTEGLRLGAYDVLWQKGARYLLPHPAWKRLPRLKTFASPDGARVVIPVVRAFLYRPTGGYAPSTTPGIPGQSTSAQAWYDWYAQNRNPREYQLGLNGDEGYTLYRQCELRASYGQEWLAWTGPICKPEQWKRGYTDSGTFPETCFVSSPSGNTAKLHYTHHGGREVRAGTSRAGFPPAPASDPWSGISAPEFGCTAQSPCLEPTDTNPQSDNDPAPNDYTSFAGLNADYLLFHRDVIGTRITRGRSGEVVGRWPHPFTRYVSVDPNDGPYMCECTKCKNLLRYGPYSYAGPDKDSSFTDRLAHLAWRTSLFLEHWAQNDPVRKPGVAWMAYNQHCEVPDPAIPIHPNSLIVMVPSSAPETKWTQAELLAAWAARRATNPQGPFELSMYPMFRDSAFTFDVPEWPGAKDLFDLTRDMLKDGYTGLWSEIGNSSIGIGRHFYHASRLAWDLSTDYDSGNDEWYELAFGPASPAVRRMFERHDDWCVLTPHEIAVSLRDMREAQAALDSATVHAYDYQTCLDHVRGFVHWLRLYLEYITARDTFTSDPTIANQASLLSATDAAIGWAWRMLTTNAINSWEIQKALRRGLRVAGGTNPPAVTYTEQPGHDVTTLRVEITWNGPLKTSTGRWSIDGGLTWTTDLDLTTAPKVVLGLTGITLTFLDGDYNATHVYDNTTHVHVIFFGQLRKWDAQNPSAPAGWSTIVNPTRAELDALFAEGIDRYTPIHGVSRITFDYGDLKPLSISTSTELSTGPWFQEPHVYKLYLDGTAKTFQLTMRGQAGPCPGITPVRVLLFDSVGNLVAPPGILMSCLRYQRRSAKSYGKENFSRSRLAIRSKNSDSFGPCQPGFISCL